MSDNHQDPQAQPKTQLEVVSHMDEPTKKAFQLAVDFYESDHRLSKSERQLLSDAFSTISYTGYASGWLAFLGTGSLPILYKKYKTGTGKGANLGVSLFIALLSMSIVTPYVTYNTFEKELSKLQQANPNCYRVAKLLPASESTRWWMYYKLTTDHPEHIMKDPRTKMINENKPQSSIYQSRDPMGLYSGPKAEMKKPPTAYPDFEAEDKKREQEREQASRTAEAAKYRSEDPFVSETNDSKVEVYQSAWDRIRSENGVQSAPSGSGGSWNKIRQTPQTPTSYTPFGGSPSSSNESFYDGNDIKEKEEFEKLLEQERSGNYEGENKKW